MITIDQVVKRDLNCDNNFSRLGSHDNWNGIVYPLEDTSGTTGGLSPKDTVELTHENVTAHIDLVKADTLESIKQIAVPGSDPTMGLGSSSDTINSTSLEIVKDSAVRILTSNTTDQNTEELQQDELNFGFEDELHMEFESVPDDVSSLSTENEIIDQEISVMNDIQSNLSSVFENSTLNTRNVTGELKAHQNIDNMIQILENQKWQ